MTIKASQEKPMAERKLSMRIYESVLNDKLLEKLIAMSADWEAENSTYGYCRNTHNSLEGRRIFLAEEESVIWGYLFGKTDKTTQSSSIAPEGTPYFEIEEIYVSPEYRSRGIGKSLYRHVENEMKEAEIDYIMLSTATKDCRRILHFYIDELGMDFWYARLFRKIG